MSKSNKDVNIGVRFTIKEKMAIKERARKAGMTMTDYVRDALLGNNGTLETERNKRKIMFVITQTQEIVNYITEKYGRNDTLDSMVKKLWKSL